MDMHTARLLNAPAIRARIAGLFLGFLGCLLLTPTAGAQQAAERPGDLAPEGLSETDWASIRAAYDAHRHAVVETDAGFRARNPGQAWVTTFDQRGFEVRPDAGGWSWGLELAAYGWGGVHAVAEPVEASSVGGRFERRWDAVLTEWCINDGRGIEHGFTLDERPALAEGPLTLDLLVRGGLHPVVSANGRDVRFVDSGGGSVLTYNNLTVFDATGRTIGANWTAAEGGLRLTVEEHDAVYPLTIDPLAQQAYLKASNTDAGDRFGLSVAVSGDTIVVGAPGEHSNATGVNGDQTDNSAPWAGAAYVFVRNGATWTQQAYLKASNTKPFNDFGHSVAISGDTVVIGAWNEGSNATGINGDQTDNSLPGAGAAYIFVRSGSIWTQQAYLKASNTDQGDGFGRSVAVSDGTIVVGALREDSDATEVNGDQGNHPSWGLIYDSGAAYVFVRDGANWTQQAYLKASNTDWNDRFGYSVAVCGDTIVVGAIGERSNATGVNGDQADNSISDPGAAYVFVRSGSAWTQQAYLKASNTDADDWFGWSVAVSGDTIVIGAMQEDSNATGVNDDQSDNSMYSSGAAYLFVRSDSEWTQQAYLKASNTDAFERFGYSVAVSGDTLVVGAPGEHSNATGVNGDQADNSAPWAGAAYFFVRNGATWTQQAYLKASNTKPFNDFGHCVAISGNTVVVGAWNEGSNATGINGDQTDNSLPGAGAAYVFMMNQTILGVHLPDYATQHRTDRYTFDEMRDDDPRTILRRGARSDPLEGTAEIEVLTIADFMPGGDRKLAFEAEHAFDAADGGDGGDPATIIAIPFYEDAVPDGAWGCTLVEVGEPDNNQRRITMRLVIPPDAPIGEYTFRAIIADAEGEKIEGRDFERRVVLLFNPWDPADAAYLEEDEQRVEYVLSDNGIMAIGSARFAFSLPWDFAQFDQDVLLASLELLGGLNAEQRASPVQVARRLTSRLDANDGGVLKGNWSGDYDDEGATAPSKWKASNEIFKAYRENDMDSMTGTRAPVRYGQSWVYAGLLTSSLRTLGMPARPVTNFESALDETATPNREVRICWEFTSDRWKEHESSESVWIHHTWVEAWMTRPDLSNRDGWQVVDATPRRRSDELYQLGPTPVSAILDGSPAAFEGPLVRSAVDADVHILLREKGVCVPAQEPNESWVGRSITTKQVGASLPEDITESYKTPETDSPSRGGDGPEVSLTSDAEVPLNQPITAELTIRNTDSIEREFVSHVLFRVMAENGREIGLVVDPAVHTRTIGAGASATIPLSVSKSDLEDWVKKSNLIEISVVVTRQVDDDPKIIPPKEVKRWFARQVVVVRGLPVSVVFEPDVRVAPLRLVTATITFSNPYDDVTLINGVLSLGVSQQIPINGDTYVETISVGNLAPGAEGNRVRVLLAIDEAEDQRLTAQFTAEDQPPGNAYASIRVAWCEADLNRDDRVNSFDVMLFIDWFLSGNPLADWNGDGELNLTDVAGFLTAYTTECP